MGSHQFEYRLGNEFFEKLGGSEFQKGDVYVKVHIDKSPLVHDITVRIQGIIQVACDRCLDDMDLPISTTDKLFVKYGQEYSEETDEIIIIPEEGVLDLSWYVYEFIALAIPIQHVHPAGKCNQAMAERLATMMGQGETAEATEEAEKPADPRWDALKKLIDNN